MDLWERAGLPISNLPTEIVMEAEDVVDAALEGFDQTNSSPSRRCRTPQVGTPMRRRVRS